MQYLTAYYPFVEIAKIKDGDFVLVGASSSSAGLGAIDMIKSCGGHVIATTRSEQKIEFLKTLRSELIGLIISISFILDLNKSLTLESVNDQVIAS